MSGSSDTPRTRLARAHHIGRRIGVVAHFIRSLGARRYDSPDLLERQAEMDTYDPERLDRTFTSWGQALLAFEAARIEGLTPDRVHVEELRASAVQLRDLLDHLYGAGAGVIVPAPEGPTA